MQIIYFVIKTHNFFIIFTFFCKNIERVENDNNLQILHVRKIWLFGYKCEGLLHACISSITTIYYPRANGAKRRSGRKPGARVTNSALAFTYIRIMRCYIAQWHSGIKSRPIFWIWTLDGFRCFAHARVSSF